MAGTPANVMFLLLVTFVAPSLAANILYPVESESRELRTLHGLWNFKISPPSDQLIGFDKKWYAMRFETVSRCTNTNYTLYATKVNIYLKRKYPCHNTYLFKTKIILLKWYIV